MQGLTSQISFQFTQVQGWGINAQIEHLSFNSSSHLPLGLWHHRGLNHAPQVGD